MRRFYLVTGLGCLLANPCVLMADELPAAQKSQQSRSNAEIRREIVGTWLTDGSFTYTNNLVSFSEALTYSTNGCYSATKTIVSAGKTRVEKCQGFWSVKDHILAYSITNSIGVSMTNCIGPEACEPFFYPQAKVVSVNGKQLILLEWMDQITFFERFDDHNKL
jgi:hypothetical protein